MRNELKDKFTRDRFIYNFIVSFVIYIAVGIIGLISSIFLGVAGIHIIGIFGVIGGHTLLSVVLYIVLASKLLKPFDNRMLNFLSVCSSFIFMVIINTIVVILQGVLHGTGMFMIHASFALLMLAFGNFEVISIYIMATLPTAIMGIGLAYKAKKSIPKGD